MSDIFKSKDKEERDGVIDKLVKELSQLLKLVGIIAAHTAEL